MKKPAVLAPPGRLRAAALVAGLLAGTPAAGAPLALPAPPQVRMVQRLGDAIPLDVTLRASDGRPVALRTLFAGERAVVLVPGYYRCTRLCGLVMQGVLEALAQSELPADSWRIVGFSIDPGDTPADARRREADFRGYAEFVAARGSGAAAPVDLNLLTSPAATSQQLAAAIGYAFERDGATEDEPALRRDASAPSIAHSTGFVVATPDGRVARYFPGVRFEPGALRLAVIDAAGGRIGSWSERLTLLCGHFDPVSGRYSLAIMGWLRALGSFGALALALWIWRRAVPRGSAGRAPFRPGP